MVAEIDGRPASAMCGYDDKESPGELSFAASQEATRMSGWSDAEFQAISDRITPVLTCISEPAPGAWIIENVVTRPEFRRRGLADQLLKTMLDIGRGQGFHTQQISVMVGNS